MSVNLNSVMVGSEDPKRLAEFYTSLFGAPGFEDDGYTGWELGSGWLMIGAHDQVTGANQQPGRLMWNLESADVQGEFDRFKAAGATVVQEPYSVGDDPSGSIATLADPDGNYFQLISPM